MARTEVQGAEGTAGARSRSRRSRRNALGVTNSDLVLIIILALVAGVLATIGTAYLGVR